MELKELNKVMRRTGGRPFTGKEVEVDPVRLVVSRAFDDAHNGSDYRLVAYGELLGLGIPFRSEGNMLWDIVKGLITVHCPYCDEDMQWRGGGGSDGSYSNDYRCTKGHEVHLTIPSDGISFRPKS